jgi:N-acylneuraminate cytidylyltransferase/CMP-N,N'-diacetyllegionaminic acid synthase
MKKTSDKGSNILVVIPARGGSVGVPRKNIKSLNGDPLISYVIKAALNSKYTLDIVVSTDDEEIAKTAVRYGASAPFLRPKEISGSASTLVLVSKHALEYFSNKGSVYDAVLSLQPTSPFISASTIDRAISTYIYTKCTSVITVSEMTNGHPYTAKRVSKDGVLSDFCNIPEDAVTFPRQSREAAYSPNGALYLRSKELIESYKSGGWQLGDVPKAVVMNERESIDINTELDFLYAEFILNSINRDA